MTLPHITCVTVTYARTALLEQAMGAFLAQDYEGPSGLIVYNTFPQQCLSASKLFTPETKPLWVKFHNCDTRPKTLGEARNAAIELAPEGSIILTLDDDGLISPGHLRLIAREFKPDFDWLWFSKMFVMEKGAIRSIAIGSPNTFCFTKRAWSEVGGYPGVSCGEDRSIISKITAKCRGARVNLRPEQITFLYGWNNGAPHISGYGFDQPGKTTGYDRIAADVAAQVRSKKVPTGNIELKVKPLDCEPMIKDYLGRMTQVEQDDVCIVELGRLGDVCNILPVALHISRSYKKPHFMVARQFASILEGVSYVTPFIFDGSNEELRRAIMVAQSRFKHVIVSQIWAPDWVQERKTSSWNRESWRVSGFQNKFDDPRWKPVFDAVNEERARDVKLKALSGRKENQPIFVVNVTHSHSSPFPQGQRVDEELRSFFKDAWFVDVATLKLDRIYDLLPLLRAADVVVTIDTALLHIAAATSTPVVALTNSKPWLGSDVRCDRHVRLTYQEAAEDPRCVCLAVNDIRFRGPAQATYEVIQPAKPPQRFLLHCCERHEENNPQERKRKEYARQTWDTLYADHGVIPCHLWNYPRTALDIGDTRALPYLKDVLSFAMQQAGEDDIIFFTNDDNMLHPDLPGFLKFHVSVYGAVAMRRCEFQRPPPPLTPREHWVRLHTNHCGRDLFAFQCGWLRERFDSIPDFILGAPEWDFAISCLIRQGFGIRSDSVNIFQLLWPAECELGYVGHVMHDATWQRPGINSSALANKHNRRLFSEWAKRTGESILFDENNTICQEWSAK
jgi:hypothetical protein